MSTTIAYNFHRPTDWVVATKLKCSIGGLGDAVKVMKRGAGGPTSASKPAMAMA